MHVSFGFFLGLFVLTTRLPPPRKVMAVGVDSSCGDCVISRMYTLDTDRQIPLSKSTILMKRRSLPRYF